MDQIGTLNEAKNKIFDSKNKPIITGLITGLAKQNNYHSSKYRNVFKARLNKETESLLVPVANKTTRHTGS